MQETIFLQFYSRRKNTIYNLLNGFSDTYDLCRQKGDFFWMPDEPDRGQWYRYDRYAARPLPISRGTIYVSALDVNHLYQCWVWAMEHPQIEFIVGGPVAAERDIRAHQWNPAYVRVDDPEALPDNLTLTGKSVEAWFGVPDFSGPWRLDIPGDIPAGSRIYFSYTLDNTCFWNRCIYCNVRLQDRGAVRRRQDMRFEFAGLPFDGAKLVRLNTGSITPRRLRRLLPVLPRHNDLEYRTFMRAAADETDALQDAVAACDGGPPDLILGLGIEFPTQRMLQHVDKGFGPDDIIRALTVCRSLGIPANGNVIVGWDNLTPADLDELNDFMDRIPAGAFRSIQMRWLFAHPFTLVHDHCKGRPVGFGPFYEGFSVSLQAPEMVALNRRAVDLFARYAGPKQYKIEGLDAVYDRLNETG